MFGKFKSIFNENTFLFSALSITAVLITVMSIIFKSQFITILPLYVSIFIMLFQAQANRIAPLIGSLNSILYAAIYIKMGLYSTVIYCLLFSFPIQLATFIRWNKNKYGKSTIFRKLNAKWRIAVAFLFLAVLVGQIFVMNKLGASNTVLDSISSLLGILISFLTLLSFIEYSWLSLILCFVNLLLFTNVAINDISRLPFVVYMLYSYVCTIKQFITIRKLFNEQQNLEETKND